MRGSSIGAEPAATPTPPRSRMGGPLPVAHDLAVERGISGYARVGQIVLDATASPDVALGRADLAALEVAQDLRLRLPGQERVASSFVTAASRGDGFAVAFVAEQPRRVRDGTQFAALPP